MKNIGGGVGSFTAGFVLAYGRRKALMVTCAIYAVGALLCQYMDFWSLLSGRFLAGIGAGFNSVCINRFLEEYVPLVLYSTASPFNLFLGQIGSFIALLTGLMLPPFVVTPEVE